MLCNAEYFELGEYGGPYFSFATNPPELATLTGLTTLQLTGGGTLSVMASPLPVEVRHAPAAGSISCKPIKWVTGTCPWP